MQQEQTDVYFMAQALRQAQKAIEAGEVPVGAVLVSEGQIITRAHNSTELLTDISAHAEILCVTAAAATLDSKYLPDCTLYVTLEPCPMCAGALAWAQLGRLVYGAADDKRGFMRFGKQMLHPKTEVSYGIMEAECRTILQAFFRGKR